MNIYKVKDIAAAVSFIGLIDDKEKDGRIAFNDVFNKNTLEIFLIMKLRVEKDSKKWYNHKM